MPFNHKSTFCLVIDSFAIKDHEVRWKSRWLLFNMLWYDNLAWRSFDNARCWHITGQWNFLTVRAFLPDWIPPAYHRLRNTTCRFNTRIFSESPRMFGMQSVRHFIWICQNRIRPRCTRRKLPSCFDHRRDRLQSSIRSLRRSVFNIHRNNKARSSAGMPLTFTEHLVSSAWSIVRNLISTLPQTWQKSERSARPVA